MAKWFGQDEPPEELKGMTQEQIIAAVKAAEKFKDVDVDDLKGRVAAAQQTASELDTLKNQVTTLTQQLEAARKPPEDPDKNKAKGPTSFLEDEDRAFNERSAPLVNALFSIGAQTAQMGFKNSLEGRDKQIYGKWGKEVEDLMSKEPAQNQASPMAWNTAFEIIKGRHINDVAKMASERTDFFAESSSGSFDAGPGNHEPKRDELTDDEKKIAKKYGLTPEAYLEQKKGMTIYHG